MTDDEARLAGLRRLVGDLETFCAHCLKIKDKNGKLVPFIWNAAQRHIHEKLELQQREEGLVRALLLKGRQQGGSTYIGGRFYHRTSTKPGQGAFIVAHEDKATANLFSMVKRYQGSNPIAPAIQASNAKELIFGALDSGYKLATAGTDDVGRSNTAQLLHGSEYAFWRNAAMHLAGIGNTISDEPGNGTEIIFESTGNGVGNSFHQLWQAAEAGLGIYRPIFVPWFWQPEYRAIVRPDLQLSSEDIEYQQSYGLDLQQMQWRANKIATYGEGLEWLFDQEYPAVPSLAFKSGTKLPLISPHRIQRAVASRYRDMAGTLIVGCDPAGDSELDHDRTAIAFRRGRVCYRVEYHDSLSTMQIAGRLAEIWRDDRPDAIVVDKGGLGAGVFDRLKELNIPVIGINNAEKARDTDTYENIRAEMWWLMRDWFMDEPCRIPNDIALQSDLAAPQPDVSSNGRKLLESKKAMAKRGIRSPDGGDALALTFSVVVAPIYDTTDPRRGAMSQEAPTAAGY